MTFADRAREAGFILPDYGGAELGAVLPAALAAVGAASAVPGRDAAADQRRLGIPSAPHVCVVMVDGLGMAQLDARRGHAPFLRSLGDTVITAGFPTTTAASLGLFGTGEPPGMTGMTGYTARNPATGRLANLISWEGAPAPEQWQPCPSLFEEAERAGTVVSLVGKSRFSGSGLTQAVLRGGRFVGADEPQERVDAAVEVASSPGLSYVYWGELDAAGHGRGWQSHEWVAQLEEADREIARLARSLPADAVLVVTADHGMVDVTGDARWDIAEVPALAEGVSTVAGEPRALHLYGDDPEAIALRWADELGAHAVVATRADALGSGVFGRVDPAMEERMGDVVVAMAGVATVVDSRVQSEASRALVGVHGSLTPDEVQVPLLVAGGG